MVRIKRDNLPHNRSQHLLGTPSVVSSYLHNCVYLTSQLCRYSIGGASFLAHTSSSINVISSILIPYIENILIPGINSLKPSSLLPGRGGSAADTLYLSSTPFTFVDTLKPHHCSGPIAGTPLTHPPWHQQVHPGGTCVWEVALHPFPTSGQSRCASWRALIHTGEASSKKGLSVLCARDE